MIPVVDIDILISISSHWMKGFGLDLKDTNFQCKRLYLVLKTLKCAETPLHSATESGRFFDTFHWTLDNSKICRLVILFFYLQLTRQVKQFSPGDYWDPMVIQMAISESGFMYKSVETYVKAFSNVGLVIIVIDNHLTCNLRNSLVRN